MGAESWILNQIRKARKQFTVPILNVKYLQSFSEINKIESTAPFISSVFIRSDYFIFRSGMTMATRRAALSLRRFSTQSSSQGSNELTSPSSSSGGVLSKWLDRVYKVWYERSGMREIYQLKEKVDKSSIEFDEIQRQVVQARNELSAALQAWEESQGQHTQLLQTRDKWTPEHAQKFASLVQAEVTVRGDLEEAKKNLSKRESQQASAQMEYMNDLRKRYHEEQIWQDKWRVLSTFGTWGLIVLNSIVFLGSQYMNQLRESRRMKDIQSLLEESLSTNSSTLQAMKEQQEKHQEHQNKTFGQAPNQKDYANGTPRAILEPSGVEDESHQGAEVVSAAEDTTSGLIDRIKRKVPAASTWKEKVGILYTETSSTIHAQAATVNAPSAILGASVTVVAWVASVALANRRSGQ
ncbi:unnamed protein product [Cylindrotheca closterium]|uniref:Sensitive to high expression protein 9, mitochondrial n=1 Tax=Cylindrotheca closterium TaxID=2856 RepID=A0AAD2G7V1_9STRA|nr:unnamed protein product [Cylindrotheca closterium]